MGGSNHIVFPFYTEHIRCKDPVALLGFADNSVFQGDLYDRKLENWDINAAWKLNRKYKTIICTRCAYFAKDPKDFMTRCFDNMEDNGNLYVDWGIGDHWRFESFKVGWVKNGEHEHAFGKENYLWSMVWDDSFMENEQCRIFQKAIEKYGYLDLKKAVYDEVPSVLEMEWIRKHFGSVEYNILTITEPYLQMYALISARK
jgi:hypothetical protein